MTILTQLNTDVLWHNASIKQKSENAWLRTNWNGYMHLIMSHQMKPQFSKITDGNHQLEAR